jgi:hypothetical protein
LTFGIEIVPILLNNKVDMITYMQQCPSICWKQARMTRKKKSSQKKTGAAWFQDYGSVVWNEKIDYEKLWKLNLFNWSRSW